MAKNIDTVILGLLLLLVVKGIWRGFKKELFSLLTYGTSVLIATSQIDNGTRFLEKTLNLHPMLGYFVAYFAVFIVAFFVIKFFVKRLIKLIRKEPSSGFIDSLAGGVFGFCLGMIVIGMMTLMLRPIPLANVIFDQSGKSLFLPLAEKYAEPVAGMFMKNPAGKLPLSQLLSGGLSDDLILPDIMKGLLGDSALDIQGLTGSEQSGGASLQDLLNKTGDESGKGIASPAQAEAYQQALKMLQSDTSSAGKKSVADLLKLIKD